MPIRLALILASILVVFLYLALLNPSNFRLVLYPGEVIDAPAPIIMLASFVAGVAGVFILYSYDTALEAFGSMRRGALRRKERRAQALYEEAMDKLHSENRHDAEKLFKKSLAHNQDHIPSLLAIGSMKREDGFIEEAVKLHSMARGLSPDNISAMLELAKDYTTAGQAQTALAILREAREKAGRSIPPLERIRDICLSLGDLDSALEAQKDIAALAPSSKATDERKTLAALIYESAVMKENGGKLEDAVDGFSGALLNDGEFVPGYIRLAELQGFLGKRKDMIKTLEKGYRATHSVIILRTLMNALVASGDMEEAAAQIKWGIEITPGQEILRLFLAETLMLQGKYGDARREMEKLDGRFADTSIYHLVEGKIREGERNVDWALKSLNEAYRKESSALFHYSCSSCGLTTRKFTARCPKCGEWNTQSPVLL